MGEKSFIFLSNSKYCFVLEVRKRVCAVNVYSERGTTQIVIKVPKCYLSVKGQKVYVVKNSRKVCLEAAIL